MIRVMADHFYFYKKETENIFDFIIKLSHFSCKMETSKGKKE